MWDAFISHASEDKDTLVAPLASMLKELGAKVWYDEFELKVGDSLSKSIDKGLVNSRYGSNGVQGATSSIKKQVV